MTATTIERVSNGQFAKGNKGGPGNPFGRRLAEMREAVQRAISVEDIERLMRVLLEQAMTGDLAAARLVLQYAVGKPKPVVEPDRVDVEEWTIQEESWASPGEMTARLREGIPVGLANAAMGNMADARTEQMAEVFTDREAAEKYLDRFVDEEDRTLTAEEIEEARREWREANERVDRERPSVDGANGGMLPSGDGFDGEAWGGSPGLSVQRCLRRSNAGDSLRCVQLRRIARAHRRGDHERRRDRRLVALGLLPYQWTAQQLRGRSKGSNRSRLGRLD